MALLTSMAIIGGATAAGTAIANRRRRGRLADVLNDGKSKVGPLLQLEPPAFVTQIQKLARDFFSDTRQQYQQSLSTTYEASVEQEAEQVLKRDLMITATGFGLATAGALLSPILYLLSIGCTLYVGRVFFQDAYRLLVEEHRFDYRSMTALLITAALLGGFIWWASFGVVFGVLSMYLVAKTENRSKQYIADLFGGQVRTVWLWVDGAELETPIEYVRVGDIVVIHAGQTIPLDGTITQGLATLDQHMLTGEYQPAEKGVGDAVFAATIVLAGHIRIRVEKAGSESVAAQISAMLSNTTEFKEALESRTERWLNQMTYPLLGASVLALPLAGLSGAVAILWYYPGYRMIVFGPLSMLSFLQIAAQRGILVKDGRALEVLQEVDTVVFDKTGTLTLEQPTVSRVFCCNGASEADVLSYAAAAEAKQEHPIARAILHAAKEQHLDLPVVEDTTYTVGYGLGVEIGGRRVRVGSIRFMDMEAITVPDDIAEQQVESHEKGHSLILVSSDHELIGAIELQPTLRPETEELVKCLHQRGLATVIISGDHEAPTRWLAEQAGVERYVAEVLPADKANLVEELQREGHKVCFIGDGINDAIALQQADVAISLRGATTLATDVAQIVLMDGSLRQIPLLFELTDEFAANMRTNFIATVAPSIIGIAGTLLFGWGVPVCMLLVQVSIPVALYNTLQPLVIERNGHEAKPL